MSVPNVPLTNQLNADCGVSVHQLLEPVFGGHASKVVIDHIEEKWSVGSLLQFVSSGLKMIRQLALGRRVIIEFDRSWEVLAPGKRSEKPSPDEKTLLAIVRFVETVLALPLSCSTYYRAANQPCVDKRYPLLVARCDALRYQQGNSTRKLLSVASAP